MTNYFEQLFKSNVDKDSKLYPYTVNKQVKAANANREAFESFKAMSNDLTLKDICESPTLMKESLGDTFSGSASLDGFIPQIFADIVQLGQRIGIARRDFPFVSQANNNSFKVRYQWMNESFGTYGEGDTLLHSQTRRLAKQLFFLKLGGSFQWTQEMINDSPISEVSNDIAMGNQKMVQLEDRCLFHQLLHFTSLQSPLPELSLDYNFIQIDSSTGDSGDGPSASELVSKMQQAYLMLLTRETDTISQGELRFYISPKSYIKLWNHPVLQQYQQSGTTTQILKSDIPPFFQVPHTIASSIGFFGDDNTWHYSDYDVLLVATGCAAIRTRSDVTMSALNFPERETTGIVMTQRLMPYVINGFRMVRIGESNSLPIKTLSDVRYRVQDQSKVDDSTRLVTLG